VKAVPRGRDRDIRSRHPVELSGDAKAALHQVSTATLTSQLLSHGIGNTFMRGLRPTRPDLRLVGYAYTLRYVPLREDIRDSQANTPNAQRRAVESIGPDDVLVIDARENSGAGTIGNIMATRLLMRGAAGIVTDGGLRDSPAVAEVDIPTYYGAVHAASLFVVHYPLETNVPIACGGTLVFPGDVIVGDAEGVVVLPIALAERVAHAALEQQEREAWALERVQSGEALWEVYPLSEGRRAEYDAWRAARAARQEVSSRPEQLEQRLVARVRDHQ
jgi:5-oxopent-3-ene-1,2,5-tricarboxylate decarboxylase / 2-hydroxyhepta-2,4-diene-1,7-dioate isomerase